MQYRFTYRSGAIFLATFFGFNLWVLAQQQVRTPAELELISKQNAIEQELESVATIDRKVMI